MWCLYSKLQCETQPLINDWRTWITGTHLEWLQSELRTWKTTSHPTVSYKFCLCIQISRNLGWWNIFGSGAFEAYLQFTIACHDESYWQLYLDRLRRGHSGPYHVTWVTKRKSCNRVPSCRGWTWWFVVICNPNIRFMGICKPDLNTGSWLVEPGKRTGIEHPHGHNSSSNSACYLPGSTEPRGPLVGCSLYKVHWLSDQIA